MMARTGDLAEAVCFMSLNQPGLQLDSRLDTISGVDLRYLAMDRNELALRPYSPMAFKSSSFEAFSLRSTAPRGLSLASGAAR